MRPPPRAPCRRMPGPARMGERPGAAARGGAGPDPVFDLCRPCVRLASKAGYTRIAVVDGGLVFGPFGRGEHGDIFRSAAGAVPRTDGEPAMKCVILAGGKGTRIAEESNTRPKP